YLLRIMIAITRFFINDTPPALLSTLSLHDALPISYTALQWLAAACGFGGAQFIAFTRNDKIDQSGLGWTLAVNAGIAGVGIVIADRKSTRLNSSHVKISYAVVCLKKKITRCEGNVL